MDFHSTIKMAQKQLPKEYKFKPEYLAHYKPRMELKLPETAVSGGKMVVADEKHPLADFISYYFRLFHKPDDIIMNAYMESSGRELIKDGIIEDKDGTLRTKDEGSIDLLRAFRDEVAKTRDYSIQKGWPKNKWPIDGLELMIVELDGELRKIETPTKTAILEL